MSTVLRNTLSLDGRDVSFTDGETVYEVARRCAAEEGRSEANGATPDVPTLCFDPRLEAFGACRLCVVEVEGIGKPVASCTTAAQSGMVVRTRTERVERHRRTLIDLVVSENPSGARIDPLRGYASQELATLAARYGSDGTRFAGATSGRSRPDDTNPMILRDYDHCISCYRCVRVCAEQEGDFAISVLGRGFGTRITTEFEGHLRDSACTFCGQCVQTCPTGALGDARAVRFQDVPGEVEKTRTICPYCGVGCSVDLLTKGDTLVGVQPAMDGPANQGALCVKGQFAWDWVQHPERLKKPLVRNEAGELVEASWDAALRRAAEGFAKVKKEHGRHAVYAVASGRAPHESAYSVQKFVRVGFMSNHVDNCSRA